MSSLTSKSKTVGLSESESKSSGEKKLKYDPENKTEKGFFETFQDDPIPPPRRKINHRIPQKERERWCHFAWLGRLDLDCLLADKAVNSWAENKNNLDNFCQQILPITFLRKVKLMHFALSQMAPEDLSHVSARYQRQRNCRKHIPKK